MCVSCRRLCASNFAHDAMHKMLFISSTTSEQMMRTETVGVRRRFVHTVGRSLVRDTAQTAPKAHQDSARRWWRRAEATPPGETCCAQCHSHFLRGNESGHGAPGSQVRRRHRRCLMSVWPHSLSASAVPLRSITSRPSNRSVMRRATTQKKAKGALVLCRRQRHRL